MTPPLFITVVGSLNVDHTLRVPRLPAPGETLTSRGLHTCFGGKGANQAVAAARAGARVRFLGCVGDDDHGTRYVEHLRAEGIDTTGISRAAEPTGSAFIALDDAGENAIIVNPGANHALTPQQIDAHADLIASARALLLQLECPLAAVQRAAQIARRAGVEVILNLSPWQPDVLSAELPIDTLIVNELEAAALGSEDLDRLGCETLLITRGAQPTRVLSRRSESLSILPPRVTPVDTVGAGDTFVGAYAAARVEGATLHDAVVFANTAAALATLTPGAQPAIPHRHAILGFEAAQV
jgi:ribokinase